MTKVEKSSVRFAAPRGWLGAVLGGLAGGLPILLIAWYFLTVPAGLYVLIPLCAFGGCLLLRRVSIAAVAVCSMAVTLLLEQAFFYLSIVRYWDIKPSVFHSAGYYLQVMLLRDAVADLAWPLLFTVLGVALTAALHRLFHSRPAEPKSSPAPDAPVSAPLPWPERTAWMSASPPAPQECPDQAGAQYSHRG